jgi:uncharacterized repeat protein (TIGR01451 family)
MEKIPSREILELEYEVEIPEKLGANEVIVGTYGLYSETDILEAPLLGLATEVTEVKVGEPTDPIASETEKNNIRVSMVSTINVNDVYSETAELGARIAYEIEITNIGETDITGIKFTDYLPEGARYYRAILYGINDVILGVGTHNESAGTVTFDIEKIEKGATYAILLIVHVEEYKGPEFTNKMAIECSEVLGEEKIELEVTDEVTSPIEITAVMSSPTSGKTIKAEDIVEYNVAITNKGETTAKVRIEDNVPEQLSVTEIQAKIGDKTVAGGASGNNVGLTNIDIEQNQTLNLKILAKVKAQAKDGEIKNNATISGTRIETVTTNSVTHLIKQVTPPTRPEGEGKITGTAWIDANEDGKQDEGEDVLKGVKVKLINVANRTIHKKQQWTRN